MFVLPCITIGVCVCVCFFRTYSNQPITNFHSHLFGASISNYVHFEFCSQNETDVYDYHWNDDDDYDDEMR